MWRFLSNKFFFPAFQVALLILLVIVLWRDFGSWSGDGVEAEVLRGPESMKVLWQYTGLVMSIVIAFVNKSVFDDEQNQFERYSVFFNLFDVGAIIYMCYFSQTGINFLIKLPISH